MPSRHVCLWAYFGHRTHVMTPARTSTVSSKLLAMLLPHLTGNIAADVRDLLENPKAPITKRMAWV